MSIEKKLAGILSQDQILLGEPMKYHTTFQVGGPADYYVRPKAEQLGQVLELCQEEALPLLVIGKGSDLLIGDKGIRGMVLEVGEQAAQLTVEDEVILRAGAGASIKETAIAAAEAGLTGLEFASGIPGSVGGAVYMNAGAYGGEIKDVLKEALVYCKDGGMRTFSNEELEFAYRHSKISEIEGIIVEAVFALEKGNQEEIWARIDDLTAQRASKQPLEYPSAGSTFKRPPGHFVGPMITEAGLKGFSVGGAQVSEKHAGFVINKDNATAADIRGLIEEIQRQIKEKYEVNLETEVKILGEW